MLKACAAQTEALRVNLLMLSGDASVAQGKDGAFYQMLRRFAAYWDRIDILCPRAPGAANRVIHDTVHIHPAPGGKLRQPAYIRARGRALIAERPYALITSQDFGFFYNGVGAYLLTRGLRIPWVSEIHHVEGYPRAVTRREQLYRAAARLYIPWAARHVAAFRVVNHVELPTLLHGWGVPAAKIRVRPALYLDLGMLRPLPGVEKRYDVLFVGRLASNKGLFTLLDALALARAAHPTVTLALRGDGPLRGQLEAYAAARGLVGNIHWLPRVERAEDMTHLYNQARMVVCASTAEGGPRVTVEAMACGVPVVTTPVGMMAELIITGINGLMFNWDADELAAHITCLLDDEALRARLGAAGMEAARRFDADAVIAGYARGYHDLIAEWQHEHA